MQSDWEVAFMNGSVIGSVVNEGHVGHNGHVTAKITSSVCVTVCNVILKFDIENENDSF